MSDVYPNNLNIEIYTPEASFAFKEASMVLMPGMQGEFGVSCGHMALLSGLKVGLVTIYDANMQIINKFIIGNGFAEITAHMIIIFTEKVLTLSSYDKESLLSEIEILNSDLASCKNEAKRKMINNTIEFNKNVIELLKHETIF